MPIVRWIVAHQWDITVWLAAALAAIFLNLAAYNLANSNYTLGALDLIFVAIIAAPFLGWRP